MTIPPSEQPQNVQNNNQHQNVYVSPTASYGTPVFDRRPTVGLGGAIKNNFKYLFHFSGRASRSEFWWVYGIVNVLAIALIVASIIITESHISTLSATSTRHEFSDEVEKSAAMAMMLCVASWLLVSILSALLTVAVSWRRLQDAGFHGALWLLSLVGLGIVPFIMYFFPSSPNGLKYDKPQDKNRP